MSRRTLRPPSDDPAPTSVSIGDGAAFDLEPLAREICRRYQHRVPDEQTRYGDPVNAWCVHDNQYLLHWGAESIDGYVDMHEQVAWLARVLEARHFPLPRLARNLDLDLDADVTRHTVTDRPGTQLAAVLVDAATFVRSHTTFLD